jgi:hypothetical protein
MFMVTDGGPASDAACDKNDGTQHAGTEFIFGGPSQMNVSNMKVEMCAPSISGRQQISIYGVKPMVCDPLVPCPPAGYELEPQSGCITAKPYLLSGGGAGCAFLTNTSDLMVFGTIYAPTAAMFLSVKNDHRISSRGLIARVVGLDMYPNAATSDAVIFSPDYGTVEGADRLMLMTACLGDTPCETTDSRAKLSAMVCIKDNTDDSVPCFATPVKAEAVPEIGHKVAVQSWTFRR